MPDRSSNQRPCDPDNPAGSLADESIDDDMMRVEPQTAGKNPHAAALGHLGGKKGGPARALKLSAEQRSEIARRAAEARWHPEQRSVQEVEHE